MLDRGGLGQQRAGEPSWKSISIQGIAVSSSDCAKFEMIDFWTLSPGVTSLVLRQKGMVGPRLDFRQIYSEQPC